MKKAFIIVLVLVVNQLMLVAQTENSNESQIVIKGTLFEVVNNEKVALPFANVFIEGTDKVTTSDFDGNFEIQSVQDINKLKCTFRGYEAFLKEINTKGVTLIELEILMKPEGTALNSKKTLTKI